MTPPLHETVGMNVDGAQFRASTVPIAAPDTIKQTTLLDARLVPVYDIPLNRQPAATPDGDNLTWPGLSARERLYGKIVYNVATKGVLSNFLYVGMRVGQDGMGSKPGEAVANTPSLKLRSMKQIPANVQSTIDKLVGTGANRKELTDQYVTRIGRFLRKISLDEVSQLVLDSALNKTPFYGTHRMSTVQEVNSPHSAVTMLLLHTAIHGENDLIRKTAERIFKNPRSDEAAKHMPHLEAIADRLATSLEAIRTHNPSATIYDAICDVFNSEGVEKIVDMWNYVNMLGKPAMLSNAAVSGHRQLDGMPGYIGHMSDFIPRPSRPKAVTAARIATKLCFTVLKLRGAK